MHDQNLLYALWTCLELKIVLLIKFLSDQLQLRNSVEVAKKLSNVHIKQSAKYEMSLLEKMKWSVIQNVIQAYRVTTNRLILNFYFLCENFVSPNEKDTDFV